MSNPWREIRPGLRTSISPDEICALAGLAHGRTCLEIGSAWGYAAIMMAQRGAAHVTSIDPHKPDEGNEQATWTGAGMTANLTHYRVADKVTMLCERSQEAMPRLFQSGARFGLVFIDGDHSLETTTHDLLWATRLVDTGFVACHDYGPDGLPSVTEACDDVFPDGMSVTVGTLGVKQLWPAGSPAARR